MTTGTIATTVSALISPHWISCPPTRLASATGSVRTCDRVRKSASRNSFHENTKARSALVTIPGTASRSATSVNARQRVAPSTIAASSRSRGRSSKKPFTNQTTKGTLNVRYAMISAQ